MNKKIPTDAFEFYFGLGTGRSYQAVADKYGVTKKAITAAAKRERWQERLAERERQSQVAVDKRAVESLTAVKEKQLKLMEGIIMKGVMALRDMPIDSAFQAVRAIISAVELERTIRGEPGERSVIDIERIIRHEYATIMLKPGEKDDWNFDAPSS